MKRNCLFIFLIILPLFFMSCGNPQKQLIGTWENQDKVIEFTQDSFMIINKNAKNVLAFQGTYTFAKDPSNCIKMKYENYMDNEYNWYSLEGTELEGYVDNILFMIDKDELQTYVIANQETYTYQRIPEEILEQMKNEYENAQSSVK